MNDGSALLWRRRIDVDAVEQGLECALIDRHAPSQQRFEFMAQHAIIRQLSEYDQFVHEAFQKEA